MVTTLDIKHQRIDDIPLLVAPLLVEMEVARQIDQQIQTHGLRQAVSVGTVHEVLYSRVCI